MSHSPESSPNVVLQKTAVSREDRARAAGQRGVVLWFTGLSGSGKSTVASEVERRLNAALIRVAELQAERAALQAQRKRDG